MPAIVSTLSLIHAISRAALNIPIVVSECIAPS